MSLTINTTAGRVQGFEEDGILSFRGIPYAAPPVGKLRWLPPEPPVPWSGTRAATSFAPIPPQPAFEIDPENAVWAALRIGAGSAEPQSEDCLYLNVYTPAADDARRPVMVWIPGGGFHSGSGSSALYRGSTLPRRGNVVVVTINYRLGALGFLNLALVTGGGVPSSGNEGLLDQIAALRWVKENIADFGGDPDNVTIFGESAGGMSAGTLLAMPAARGLFHKVIAQSGASSQVQPIETAVKVAERFLDVHGLKGNHLDAIRGLTAEHMVQAVLALQPKPGEGPDPELGGAPMRPVVDGETLPAFPLDALAAGSADGIPVLVGTTLEENKLMSALRPDLLGMDESRLRELLHGSVAGWDPSEIIERYRVARSERHADTSPLALFNAIETDRVFRMPAVRLAETIRDRGGEAYSYLFTWTSPLLDGIFGACHALDIGFVWGTHTDSAAFSGAGPTADRLATTMQDAWIAFARTGNPSCAGSGTWPRYGTSRETMMLGEECCVENAPLEAERRAWDGTREWVIGWT